MNTHSEKPHTQDDALAPAPQDTNTTSAEVAGKKAYSAPTLNLLGTVQNVTKGPVSG